MDHSTTTYQNPKVMRAHDKVSMDLLRSEVDIEWAGSEEQRKFWEELKKGTTQKHTFWSRMITRWHSILNFFSKRKK